MGTEAPLYSLLSLLQTFWHDLGRPFKPQLVRGRKAICCSEEVVDLAHTWLPSARTLFIEKKDTAQGAQDHSTLGFPIAINPLGIAMVGIRGIQINDRLPSQKCSALH